MFCVGQLLVSMGAALQCVWYSQLKSCLESIVVEASYNICAYENCLSRVIIQWGDNARTSHLMTPSKTFSARNSLHLVESLTNRIP